MNFSSLTLGVKYTRPELARRWGYASHKAIERGVVTPKGGKVLILFVTRVKQAALTPDLSGGVAVDGAVARRRCHLHDRHRRA